MNNMGGDGISLWDEQDEFFYDVLRQPDGHRERLKLRSIVGLIPLFAVETIEPELLAASCRISRAPRVVPANIARSSPSWCRAGKSPAWASGA